MKLAAPVLTTAFAAALAVSLAPAALAQGLPGAAPAPETAGAPMLSPAPALSAAPAGVIGGPMAAPDAAAVNDYPTEARAEYVFACMATNGRTADTLRRCACSIDVIASIVPYDDYVEAEAVLALMQTSGERVEVMRNAAPAKAFVQDLRRAQSEGSVRCF